VFPKANYSPFPAPQTDRTSSVKITDVQTTLLIVPRDPPISDATAIQMTAGGYCFVHLRTDQGIEGLGMSAPSHGLRAVVEHDLKDILLGADPFDIEGLWQDMFWRVRGFGRKGLAFQAISAVDIALWDLKAKAWVSPSTSCWVPAATPPPSTAAAAGPPTPTANSSTSNSPTSSAA